MPLCGPAFTVKCPPGDNLGVMAAVPAERHSLEGLRPSRTMLEDEYRRLADDLLERVFAAKTVIDPDEFNAAEIVLLKLSIQCRDLHRAIGNDHEANDWQSVVDIRSALIDPTLQRGGCQLDVDSI